MSIMADEAVKATNEQGGQNLHIGIDVGSTTVKLAVLNNDNEILWAVYRRHHADVRATIVEVLREAAAAYPDETIRKQSPFLTGLPAETETLHGSLFAQLTGADTAADNTNNPQS